MRKSTKIVWLSLVSALGCSQLMASSALAGEIVMIKGARYERCGDKLYPQVDSSWTDPQGVNHPNWITDYSTYVAPQTNPMPYIAPPKVGAVGKVQPAVAKAPAVNKVPAYSVRDQGRKHFISISADMLFDFDKATLTPKAEAVLAEIAPLLKKYGAASVVIDGHTDNIGTDAYNQDLSERRAETVKTRLLALGAVSDNATIRGFGSHSPVANNTYGDGTDFPQGRAKNRRVEITVETTETASAEAQTTQ